MNVNVGEGKSSVQWNDRGDPITFAIDGTIFQCSEEGLRDLYECLDFLYGNKHVRPA